MNVVRPLLRLQKAGTIQLRVTLEFTAQSSELDNCDLVVFCRNTDPRYFTLLDELLARGIPYIYDLDDNLFEVPLDSDVGKYHQAPEQKEMLSRYLIHATWIRVYSQSLLEKIKAINENIERMVPPLDWDLINPRPEKKNSPITIVYATSRKDDSLSKIFTNAIRQIVDKYGNKVAVFFLGYIPPDLRKIENIRHLPFISDYSRYLGRFSKSGYDIGLAPLVDDEFHKDKTNNKYREYAACGICGIYSNVPVYSECVNDQQTGLLVGNTMEEWVNAISQLVEDSNLREQIRESAFLDVKKTYSLADFDSRWFNQISKLASLNPASTNGSLAPSSYSQIQPEKFTWINQKIANTIRWLNRGDIIGLLKVVFLQVQNFWILFKINTCKTL